MKNFRLSSIAAAVGLVVAGAASAQVNLDLSSPTTIKYAAELTPPTGGITLRDGGAANQTATVNTGATLTTGAIGYIRLDLSGGTFNGTPTGAMVVVSTNANVANGAGEFANVTGVVAQSSSNYAVFSVNPGAAGRLEQNRTVTIDTDTGTAAGIAVTSKAGVSLQYRLYDNLADAVNGNATTSVKNVTKPYISFQSGFSSTPSAGSAIANVSATQGAYLRFTDGSLTAQLGNFAFAFDGNVAAAGGAALAGTELGSTSTVVVTAATGNFSFAANANGGFDTLSNVRFTNGADCTAGTNVAASSITSTTATFTNVPASFFNGTQRLCVTARSGATIGAGTYQLSSTIAGTSTSYGNFASASSVASWSTITQNGATINIPLVQTPAGFLIRLAVTNSGSSARAYTVSTVAETGATATVSGALASGEFAAGRLTVIDLPGLLTVTGAPGNAQRTALRMIVNAPASEIRAVYQVTAPNGTSVSNQPLTVE